MSSIKLTPSMKERIMDFSDKHHALFAVFVTGLSFLASIFAMVLVWSSASTLYGTPVVDFQNRRVDIFHTRSGSWLQVSMDVVAGSGTWMNVSRELTLRSNSERIILPSSEAFYPGGRQQVNAVYTLPMQIAKGEWCLDYTIRYRKAWAIWDRAMTTTIGCTRVEPMISDDGGNARVD